MNGTLYSEIRRFVTKIFPRISNLWCTFEESSTFAARTNQPVQVDSHTVTRPYSLFVVILDSECRVIFRKRVVPSLTASPKVTHFFRRRTYVSSPTLLSSLMWNTREFRYFLQLLDTPLTCWMLYLHLQTPVLSLHLGNAYLSILSSVKSNA